MTTSSCKAFGTVEQTDTRKVHSQCSQTGPDGNGATAQASADETIIYRADEHQTLIASQGVKAFAKNSLPSPDVQSAFGGSSSAKASASIKTQLKTGGKPRFGFVYGSIHLTGEKEFSGLASTKASVGPEGDTPWFSQELGMDSIGQFFPPSMIGIELGTTFELTFESAISSAPAPPDGESGGAIESKLIVRFLEADGITPVSISSMTSAATA